MIVAPRRHLRYDPTCLSLGEDERTDHALAFGDKSKDIEAARNAGIKSVGCTWGSLEVDELYAPYPDFHRSRSKRMHRGIVQEIHAVTVVQSSRFVVTSRWLVK